MNPRDPRITRRTLVGALALGPFVARRSFSMPAAEGTADATPRLRTVGVVGGIGPQATMDFEERVHRAAQERLPRFANSGYPPMVVYYHRRPPILLHDDGSPIVPFRPDPSLLEAVRKLGAMADFLVITSNGAHAVQADVERASGREVLSMVDLTVETVRQKRWTKVGVVGMGDPVIYTKRLDSLRIAHETLDPERRRNLDRAFLQLMAGLEDAESRRFAAAAVGTLRRRGVEGIILGCTELALLLGDEAQAPDLVNPLQLLAEATVVRAAA
jgi:aspartate racemase